MKQWRKGDKITTLKELWERISGGGYVYYRDEVISPEVAKTLQAEDVEEAVLKEGRVFKAHRVYSPLDWDIELAFEIGLVSEMTHEIQEKLDTMKEAYIDNYKFIQESMIGTFPRTILESEAKQRLENVRSSLQSDIKDLEQTIKDLEWDNRELRFRLRELREKYEQD